MGNFVRRLQRMGAGGNITVGPIDPEEPIDGVRMYLSPASGMYVTDSTVQVQIRINAGDIAVNAYQANVYYPTSLLRFESMSIAGSPFTMQMVNTASDGRTRLSAAILGGTTSGDQLLGTITFTAIGNGDVQLEYDTVNSGVARASDSTAAANQFDGASYTIAPV